MTQDELTVLLSKIATNTDEVVKGLQKTSYKVPSWSDLEKQYNPKKHKIWDTTLYPKKENDNNTDDFKRTALALQKLAVNRVAQSMFTRPVIRKYSGTSDSDAVKEAIEALEEIYRTENTIDGENIERAKSLNKSCQIATVWSTRKKETIIKGKKSDRKLIHTTYSEPDGYKLYPINDEFGELLVISIYYKSDNKEYLDVYTNEEQPKYLSFVKDGSWVLDTERSNLKLEVFPVVYTTLPEPVWGGDDGTNLVEQLEEMESYDGMYIKRNSSPTFTLDYGKRPAGSTKSKTDESINQIRKIIELGENGKMDDVTWKGAVEALNNRYQRLRNSFFEQIQVPDTSFANMIKSNTSAENKELIFSDAKAKAKDLGGAWEKFFLNEIKIVKAFVSVLYPGWGSQLEGLSVRSVITPYSVRSKKEVAEYINLAGDAMSLKTKVKLLDEVDDIDQEIELIEEDNSRQTNNL